jgi:hypothetical protein
MSVQDQIKGLEEALESFKGIQENQEVSYTEAMETAKGMPESDEKNWAINSLIAAKAGKLTAADFMNQIKERGYGS